MRRAKPEGRSQARKKILQAVNSRIRLGESSLYPMHMKHIQRAVHIARQQQLVDQHTLEEAGFNDRNR